MAVVPPSRCSMQPSSADRRISSGVRPAVSAWLRHMNAGWLRMSPVPFSTLVGECVCALTRPGSNRRSRPSITRAPDTSALPGWVTAAIDAFSTTTSARRAGPAVAGSSSRTSLMTSFVSMRSRSRLDGPVLRQSPCQRVGHGSCFSKISSRLAQTERDQEDDRTTPPRRHDAAAQGRPGPHARMPTGTSRRSLTSPLRVTGSPPSRRALPALSPAGVQTIDARGHLVLPGFINAHYHSHDVLAKGTLEEVPLESWRLYALPPQYPPRSAEEVYARTLLGALECLRSGMTTVQDMLTLYPYEDRHMDAVMDGLCQGRRAGGVRAAIRRPQGPRNHPVLEGHVPARASSAAVHRRGAGAQSRPARPFRDHAAQGRAAAAACPGRWDRRRRSAARPR